MTDGVNTDDYGITLEDAQSPSQPSVEPIPDAEPADPKQPDHKARRDTRLVPESFDAHNLPKPLVECGCGECSDRVDPLADESHAFRDVYYARDECPTPQS